MLLVLELNIFDTVSVFFKKVQFLSLAFLFMKLQPSIKIEITTYVTRKSNLKALAAHAHWLNEPWVLLIF